MPATDIVITDISSDDLTPVLEITSVRYLDTNDRYISITDPSSISNIGLTAAFVSGDL